MVEDRLLMWEFRRGSRDALRRIYEKYEGYLLTLASALLNDVHTAEDVVHDFFVSFAQAPEKLKLDGNLKSYLVTCVANRARDKIRERQRQRAHIQRVDCADSGARGPELSAVCDEELQKLSRALGQLPYQQREVMILHLRGGMKFRQIAKSQGISMNTVKSRYRYGLRKLRELLDGEAAK